MTTDQETPTPNPEPLPNPETVQETQEQAKPAQPPNYFERRPGRIILFSAMGIFGVFLLIAGISYLKFAPKINGRLEDGPFSGTVNIYSAPRSVAVGDSFTAEDIVGRLRHAGYSTSRGNTVGWFNVRQHAVEIFPGRDAYLGGEPALLEFRDGKIARIVSLGDHTERKVIDLEPQLIANLSEQREKRRLVHFNEIPQSLVRAVVSVEDKHFFQHSGFDMSRILKAAYVDLREGRKQQGASTLTMQLARGFWLDPDKNWKRKIEEFMITLQLESKLPKQRIFEYYANQVYLGRHGTFSINGFGEAARVYFGKDLPQLSAPESALLAGMIQRPSYFNPYRSPDRAKERRDIVLLMMKQNGYLTESQYREAIATPVKVHAEPAEDLNNSQYFVDLMNQEVQARLDEHEKQMHFIYTTLDPDLQESAERAVADGMGLVDKQLRCGGEAKTAKGKKTSRGCGAAPPQVALIALDPHTGEIKALVGGRDYGKSQLNHVLSMRQPGSVFKPFVYAAALETAVTGGGNIFTPASTVDDSPTTFYFDRTEYQPGNFHQNYMGRVTLRNALAHSLNVATVQLAQQVGYDRVVRMAHRVGLNEAIKPTPAVALGAYETTPLEIAGAYTVFANDGTHVTPTTISLVRAPDGTVVYQHQTDSRNTLDSRVTYLMVSIMQDVLRYGTGAGVHGRGFNLPAAGKTGTSHDGWFAGFTTNLLCVVWVGYDDNRELNLEGAKSALPIWTDFMKSAAKFHRYQDVRNFQAPPGVTGVRICADSGQLAGQFCPNVRSDMFIDGTQPAVECQLHSPGATQFADRVIDGEEPPPATLRAATVRPVVVPPPPPAPSSPRTVPPVTSGARTLSTPPPVTTPVLPPASAPRTIAPAPTAPPKTVPPASGGRTPAPAPNVPLPIPNQPPRK
jgi:penicillin-binding protein 1B